MFISALVTSVIVIKELIKKLIKVFALTNDEKVHFMSLLFTYRERY